MDVWLIICLGLSALLAVNAVGSFATWALWRWVEGRSRRAPASLSARFLFSLRIFPLLGALIVALALFVPSYIAYEPRPADEVISYKLAALASVAAFGIASALWSALASWKATRRLLAHWMREAEAVRWESLPLPVFRFPHPFPVVAVVGVFRPRLFIADCVLDSLEEREIQAAVAHEIGHLAARDNLKLGLMRICKDVLALLPGSQLLERAWSSSAEAEADAYAARAGKGAALDLAAALIKITRLTEPEESKPAVLCLVGDDPANVAWRVRRLVELAESAGESARLENVPARWTWSAYAGGVFAAIALAAACPRLLATVHSFTEQLFPFLK